MLMCNNDNMLKMMSCYMSKEWGIKLNNDILSWNNGILSPNNDIALQLQPQTLENTVVISSLCIENICFMCMNSIFPDKDFFFKCLKL